MVVRDLVTESGRYNCPDPCENWKYIHSETWKIEIQRIFIVRGNMIFYTKQNIVCVKGEIIELRWKKYINSC